MPKRIDLKKEDILRAMANTKSNKAAARYLGVSYIHYKKWAKCYHIIDGGSSLFEAHKNQSGKGIPKFLSSKSDLNVLDIIEGRISPKHFKPEKIKEKMIEEGYIKEECSTCGYHERRVSDYKIPLILNFKDNNPNHYHLGNIRFLCYNCYFIFKGDIFNKNDLKHLETHEPSFNMTKEIDFQLDEYQLEQLEKLGLYEPPKVDDGSEFVSYS